MVDDVPTGFRAQSVVKRNDDHRETVERVLSEDPFGAVLTVDADQGVGSGSESKSHEAGSKVLGSEQGLFISHPLVLLCGTLSPSKARSVIYLKKRFKKQFPFWLGKLSALTGDAGASPEGVVKSAGVLVEVAHKLHLLSFFGKAGIVNQFRALSIPQTKKTNKPLNGIMHSRSRQRPPPPARALIIALIKWSGLSLSHPNNIRLDCQIERRSERFRKKEILDILRHCKKCQ